MPHLLHPSLRHPLHLIARSLGQADRARLCMACRGLNQAVLEAGGWECTVGGDGGASPPLLREKLASFRAWLAKVPPGSVESVRLPYNPAAEGVQDTVATLGALVAAGPRELLLDALHGQGEGEERPPWAALLAALARLRSLRTLLLSSTDARGNVTDELAALDGMDLEKLVLLVRPAAGGKHGWRPRLPRLVDLKLAHVFPPEQTPPVHPELGLDRLPFLRKLDLVSICTGEWSTTVVTAAASQPLSHLRTLELRGGALDFPWQRAPALEELVLFGRVRLKGGLDGMAPLRQLRDLDIHVPLPYLLADSTWLRSITRLHLRLALNSQEAGRAQVRAGGPPFARLPCAPAPTSMPWVARIEA